MTDTLLIQDSRSLARLVQRLQPEPQVALDTEFLRERTYYPKLCLIQLGAPGLLAVVDPLSVADLEPLWDWLTGGVEVLLHAASQDLEIVHRACGRAPARHFDTQVAAAFLGYGDSIGYARLVDRLLGQTLRRSEAYTDWGRRPLTPEQRQYALDDVRYLPECAGRLRAELERAGRLEWVTEELDAIRSGVRSSSDPDRQWRRVSGARSLKGVALAVLREAAAWRENEAMRRDLPRQRVVPDRVLVELARRRPKSRSQVEQLRGLHPREAQRSAAALLDAVARAERAQQQDWPQWPSSPAFTDDARTDALASFLDACVRTRAVSLNLSPRLLATRSDLERLAKGALAGSLDPQAEEPAILRGWRREIAGQELLELLAGRRSVRIQHTDDGPELIMALDE